MDQNKTYNLVSAGSSLKNYEFDFGNLSGSSVSSAGARGGAALGGLGGASLKQQKMAPAPPPQSTSTASTGAAKGPHLAAPSATQFKPMAAPWEVASEKLGAAGTASVRVAPSQTVQAAFKEKSGLGTAPGAGSVQGGAQGSAAAATPSWMANYLSSAQAGTAMGKPDPLAGLWSATATSAPFTGTASAGGAKQAAFPGTAAAGGASQAPSSAGVASDPFDFFTGGRQSLAAMKTSRSSAGAQASSPVNTQNTPSAGAESLSRSPFDLSSVKAAVPSTPAQSAAASPAPAAADPFAQFGQSSTAASSSGGDPFGGFSTAPPSTASASASGLAADPFASFGAAPASSAASAAAPGLADFSDPFGAPSGSATARGGTSAASNGFEDVFGALPAATSVSSAHSADPLADMLFQGAPAAAPKAAGTVGADDWGAVFGESAVTVEADAGGTVELEGLPPPPAGLTAGTASEKGESFYKAGQFADAIKWLLWAEALAASSGSGAGKTELLCKVLTTRAGCYKEAGEMKKAVADCSQVLELDSSNTTVRLQRALLYEGMEKYKLGVEDLREVLRLDPSNRPAMNLLNRLSKMV